MVDTYINKKSGYDPSFNPTLPPGRYHAEITEEKLHPRNGIGYFLIGPSPLDPSVMASCKEKGPDYLLGFQTGYGEQSRSKKRGAFLGGSLTGMVVMGFMVIVIASSLSDMQLNIM
jgi:hypothetical protein